MKKKGSANSPPSRVTQKLARYRRKRSAGRTPEPFGGDGEARRQTSEPTAAHLFTIQKHAARRVHYDFRLEWHGVLLSWAVPRGPSYDPDDKRLAVEVEDHPVEYADFEGVIPAGNYGAGGVIVWDKGAWTPVEDPDEGLQKGKLVFMLEGHKLRGEWTLVRTKKKGQAALSKEWLLIKHRDAYAGKGRPIADTSILSGRTVEEVARGADQTAPVRKALKKAKAKHSATPPRDLFGAAPIEPMLAETREAPFDDAAFLFELKYDGYRLLARRQGGKVTLHYRHGSDASALFPELVTALSLLPGERFVLDGELVVLDADGRPSFQRLQQRTRLRRGLDVASAVVAHPASYQVFDLLAWGDHDLRGLPLVARKAVLRALLPSVGPVRYADHVEGSGVAFFEAVAARGLEGVVAKRKASTYRAGRSPDWLKVRTERAADFAVVGYAPSDKRPFAALHLALWDGAGWGYAGRVGGGFTDAQLRAIGAVCDAHVVKRSVVRDDGPRPEGRAHVWCEPTQVVEVRYREWTDEGVLRLPTFLRVRDDKAPKDCLRELVPDAPANDAAEADEAPAATEPIPASARTVPFSNRDKLFWPEDGLTKGDLIDYHRAIAPFMLPYLQDRPLVLTRYPDGIHGKSFFQKDAPGYVPPWLRTERMWSEHAQREIDYFICEDEASLLYVVNLGTIPIHVWSSRVRTLPTPDWCILDLDPKDAPFRDVVTLARAIHGLCEDIELPSWCKTSGSTGLHVLVPVGRAFSYEQSKTLGELICRVIEAEHPDLSTTERVIERRRGRVYLDFLQNGHGKTIVAPYSVRPLPGAPVSMPITWREVSAKLDPRQFTMRDAPRRMAKLGTDPMTAVIDASPPLDRVIERLAERVSRAAPPRSRR